MERIAKGGAFDEHGQGGLALYEHEEIYKFVGEFCSGRVLEAACGRGYGSKYINRDELVGIDIDPKNLQYCSDYNMLIQQDLEEKIDLSRRYPQGTKR